MTGIDGRGRLPPHMRILLEECPAGGIMLFRYNLDTDNDAIKNLIADCMALDGFTVPPFISVDHEGGKVNRFLPGIADMPPAFFYWELAQSNGRSNAITQIITDSFRAGKAINDLGINLNFAPIAEYLNDDNRIFLDDRSYGPDPVFTAEAAGAFITGMELAGVMCVVKHFPGSAGADPHYFPGTLLGSRAALADLAAPFTALIRDNHTRAIMVSHSSVPARDSNNIASLSPAVMGDWLRQELGFEGIIICDDFSMEAAIAPAAGQQRLRPESAAVQSLIAGADMILVWPPDLRRTHRTIQAALSEGTLSRERLREAAERIIQEKLQLGLIREEGRVKSVELRVESE
jgi:beta-N-acetylhexosaminidase